MNKNLKHILIIGAILVGLLIIASSIWGGVWRWTGSGFGPMMGREAWGTMVVVFIFVIAFWALVIWGIVSLIRWFAFTAGSNQTQQGVSALEILKQRYARGEINKEEFEQKRKDLGG